MTDDEKRELADVYEKAAARMENSTECIWAAIFYAGDRESITWQAGRFASEALELGGDIPALFRWNDERDKVEVINTLHGLANKLR